MLVDLSTLKTILNGLIKKINEKADKSDLVQPDWNQNDETAADYIKNRPFYDATDLKQLDEKYLPDTIARTSDLITPKDYIILKDISGGPLYKIQIKDGNLTSTIEDSLEDFTYTTNADGTYTITGWNETYMGKPSTIMVIPDDKNIIV